ncbi:MAG: metallophosphoesterase [Xanthomonadales bacterium]|jgi:hypothetical protein|nr:metallophosphoesterase [Xanthomonadales bacterium]
MTSTRLLHVIVAVLSMLAWNSAQAGPEFVHDVTDAPHPWTHERFDRGEDRLTFAVFADITGGERPGVFDLAAEQLNLLRPELILNVGDLIAGSDDPEALDREWARFGERTRAVRAPIFLTGGNHDLLGPDFREAWAQRNGPSYYHFRYRDVLFLVLDTEDHTPERLAELAAFRREAFRIADEQGWDAFYETPYATAPESAAGNVSPQQAAYFIDVLEANPDVRHTFVIMHKAPWLRDDLEAFARLESVLAERPYTVFHGHEHGYRHQLRNGRDYIQLATTGGVFLPENGPAFDHVLLVTVDGAEVTLANLRLSGILDKTGSLPGPGSELCLAYEDCPGE